MDNGKILEINQDKKYGLILLNDGEKACFNANCLYRTVNFDDLTIGLEVEFYLQRSYNGFLAIEIRPQQQTMENNLDRTDKYENLKINN